MKGRGVSGTSSRALHQDLMRRSGVVRTVKGSRFKTAMSPRSAQLRRLSNRDALQTTMATGLFHKIISRHQAKGILRGQGYGSRGRRRDSHGRFA